MGAPLFILWLRLKLWFMKRVLRFPGLSLEERMLTDLDNGWAQPRHLREIFAQRRFFESRRRLIEARYEGQVVGACAGQLIAAATVHEVFDEAERRFPGRLVYFEPVGFDIL